MAIPLGLRLALAFLAVALMAIALLAGLTAAFAAADVSVLAGQQRTQLTSAIAVAAGVAWDRGDSWASADLVPVVDLAANTGADVAGARPGRRIPSPPRPSSPTRQARRPAPRWWSAGSGSAKPWSGSPVRA